MRAESLERVQPRIQCWLGRTGWLAHAVVDRSVAAHGGSLGASNQGAPGFSDLVSGSPESQQPSQEAGADCAGSKAAALPEEGSAGVAGGGSEGLWEVQRLMEMTLALPEDIPDLKVG